MLVGYTTGPWNNPSLGWAEPKKKMSEAQYRDSIQEKSSACAFIWNKAREELPEEIVKDLEDANAPRMDFNRPEHQTHGPYHVREGEQVHEKVGQYGPGAGFAGVNYARSVAHAPLYMTSLDRL